MEDLELNTSTLPDFVQLVKQRTTGIKETFDPHQIMVNKKQDVPLPTVQETDLETLQNFCNEHGIVGFNCGRMSPIAALSMLKAQMGIVDVPFEERYSSNNNNSQKTILHG
jgi:hypothetical protein